MAWSNVTLPLSEGGLGIKEALSWNKTIFLKLAWDVIQGRHCLWTNLVIQNHTRGTDLVDVQPLPDDSWLWKTLVRSLGEFQTGYIENSEGNVVLC